MEIGPLVPKKKVFEGFLPYIGVIPSNETNEIANCEDPDQTTPLGAIPMCPGQALDMSKPGQTCPKTKVG